MGETPPIRAFVAVKLPRPVLDELATLSQDLRIAQKNLSWTQPRNMHITLRFLGDLTLDQLERFSASAIDALSDHAPLTLRAQRLGAFPDLDNPRVLWAGLNGDLNALDKLHQASEDCATQAGLEPEQTPYKPHITLAHFHRAPLSPALREAIRRHAEFRGSEFHIGSVTLFSSTQGPSGPIYKSLQEYPLPC